MKFLTPLILFAISISLFIWYVNPTYKKIGELRFQLSEYQLALVRAEQASTKRDDLVNRWNSFSKRDLERLATMLPDKVDNIHLIIDVNSMLKKYNATPRNIAISSAAAGARGAATTEQPYGTAVLSFATTMSYDNFQDFLADTEKSLRLVDVGNVAIRPAAAGGGYDFTISLNAYWLK